MKQSLPAAARRLAAAVALLLSCAVLLAPSSGARSTESLRTESLRTESPQSGSPQGGRVLVLGFDGADWRKTESMMATGELPNLAKLRDMGTAGPLVSTDPAESAAGWAAINTGANPVKNGIPSFIKRNLGGEQPSAGFAHVDVGTAKTADMEMVGSTAILSRLGGSTSSIAIGIGVLIVAFLLFKFVLRAHAILALILGVLLGGAASYATSSAAGAVPEEIPGVVSNQIKLDGFWVEAARAGHPSVALQAPLAFGRPAAEGARTLYGLGIPDARGSLNGDWFLYTTDTLATGRAPKGQVKRGSSGTGVTYRVDFKKPKEGGEPAIETRVYGPINFAEMDVKKRRHAEINATLEDPDKRGGIGFQESKALLEERTDIEEALAEMGSAIPGSNAAVTVAPKDYKHRVSAPLRVVKSKGGDSGEAAYTVTIGDQSQELNGNDWSEFYSVKFELSPVLSVHAVTRARVVNTDPFELYVDTLQFDPANPTFWQPTSSPIGFSADLASKIGSPFETLGWGCMTNQVKDKLVDPKFFMEDIEFTMTYRKKLMERMIEENDWRVLFSVFSTPDRVQHMMYRFHDPEHPNHDAKKAAETITFFGEEITLGDAIPAIYRQMDVIVGEAMAALGPNDTLMLCADHGFTSYRRGMHVNNWLESEGFLVLKEGLADTGQGSEYKCVDWSKTKAYSLGLGMVYLNLEGREPNGIVSEDDAQGVMEEIRAAFLAATDEGRRVGTSATIMRDAYAGPDAWGTEDYPCADVMLGFAEFYRVSWKTVAGTLPLRSEGEGDETRIVPAPIYDDNSNPWSGDHASNDPNLVTGIFFCNRKVTSEDGKFSVMDIAPTVLDRLGAEQSAQFDRKPLTFQ